MIVEELDYKIDFKDEKIYLTAYHQGNVIKRKELNDGAKLKVEFWLFHNEVLNQFLENMKRSALIEAICNDPKKLQLSSLYGEIKKEGEPDATDET